MMRQMSAQLIRHAQIICSFWLPLVCRQQNGKRKIEVARSGAVGLQQCSMCRDMGYDGIRERDAATKTEFNEKIEKK